MADPRFSAWPLGSRQSTDKTHHYWLHRAGHESAIFWAAHAVHLIYANGGDEHGILRGAVLPALDDTVWLIHGHCDPTVNLHDHLLGVRGGLQHGTVEQIIKVDGRGALT